MNKASVDLAQRPDGALGPGWRWSTRDLGRVIHDYKGVQLFVKDEDLYVKMNGNRGGKMRFRSDVRYPYLKVVLLTYDPEAISEISSIYSERDGSETFNM